MASVNSLLKPINLGGTVRDYKHASRTFVDNNYELQPKHSFLFHVVFNFMPEAATLFNTVEKLEIPILVKSIDLPQYTIDVQTHNQYNRKVQSHHGMQYQPINAVFHDDAKELIRNLWHKYYIFYNADPTYDLNSNSYTPYDKYSDRVQQQWGFQRGNKRFFKDIKIYSMHNHKFAEYTLVNPMITAFNHDTHAYANGGLMEHRVQFTYETVKYATGFVNNVTPTGFGDLHYDAEFSDLAAINSENSAFIDGDLKDVTGQRPNDLFQGNVIGTIKDADIIFNTNKPITSGSVIQDTLSIVANNLLTGQKPTTNIFVPTAGAIENLLTRNNNVVEQGIDFVASTAGAGTVKSQGKSINTSFDTQQTAEITNVGFANTVPRHSNIKSNINSMSDNRTYYPSSTTAGTRTQKEVEIAARINDPSISASERADLRDRLDSMKRG